MQSSNTNPTNEIFDISYSYKKQINKIWHHIKLSADSDPLQLEASKKPNPTKLQMFHNYFLNWLIVFIKKPSHFLFFIIPQRDKNILICTFFIAGAFPLSDVSLMTDVERKIFLPVTETFTENWDSKRHLLELSWPF